MLRNMSEIFRKVDCVPISISKVEVYTVAPKMLRNI